MDFSRLTTDQLFDLHHELCGAAHALVMLCLAYLGAHPYGTRDAAYLALSDLWEQANAQAKEAHEAYLLHRAIERADDGIPDEWCVDMVCTACRCPASTNSLTSGVWYHTRPADTVKCPVRPITVMVAAGNENI